MNHLITELNKQDFYKIKHVTDKCKNIEVRAVVNGNNPGRIFVANPIEPTTALIWIQGQEGYQIVGDAQCKSFVTGLEDFIRNNLEPELKMRNINWVEIGVDFTWDRTIQAIFNKRNISSDIQHVFSKNENSLPIEIQDNKVFIQRIDRDLLKSGRLANHSFLEKKILRFWNSLDSFSQHGFGYFAEMNNNVVSLCFSAFVADQTHAIEIETLEEFRRKSYGTAVARAFVQECVEKGIQPYWDCSPDNTGSIGVAQTIGLSSSFDYKIFCYNLS